MNAQKTPSNPGLPQPHFAKLCANFTHVASSLLPRLPNPYSLIPNPCCKLKRCLSGGPGNLFTST